MCVNLSLWRTRGRVDFSFEENAKQWFLWPYRGCFINFRVHIDNSAFLLTTIDFTMNGTLPCIFDRFSETEAIHCFEFSSFCNFALFVYCNLSVMFSNGWSYFLTSPENMIIHSGRSKIDNFVASLVHHNRLWSAVLQFQEGGREDEGGARGLPKHTINEV